jgi:hypothetical protein
MLTSTPRQAILIQELAAAHKELDIRERLVAEAENKIKAALGEHTGFYSPYGTVSWKTTKERRYIDWEQIAYEVIGMLPPSQDPAAVAASMDAHTQVKPGVRRFTYTPAEES